jgi:hypothetical protein
VSITARKQQENLNKLSSKRSPSRLNDEVNAEVSDHYLLYHTKWRIYTVAADFINI